MHGNKVHIGCSGWSYQGWKGTFYPAKLASSRWLGYYASVFDTVEVDSTFYTIPETATTAKWSAQVPDAFTFVAKMFRGITHDLGKGTPVDAVAGMLGRFYRGMDGLGTKLAAILVQFPPNFSTKHAGALVALAALFRAGIHHVIEFRHPSWFDGAGLDGIESLVARGNISIAGSIQPHVQPFFKPTGGDAYIFRFIGDRALTTFGSIQRDKRGEMISVKEHLQAIVPAVRSVHVFFNNHYAGFGPASANHFKEIMSIEPRPFGRAAGGQAGLDEFA